MTVDLMAALERSLSTINAPAIVPDRVLILSEREQRKLAETMSYLAQGDDLDASRLYRRITQGDTYENEVDELTRITFTKRKLEEAVRRVNKRITELDPIVVEQLVEQGHQSVKHAGTGANLRIDQKIWAKVVKRGEKVTDDEKDKAAHGLIRAGLGGFVKQGFNTNSVSAHFREIVKTYNAQQQALPEQERVPRPVAEFIPAELVGLIELEDTPTISVTASRS